MNVKRIKVWTSTITAVVISFCLTQAACAAGKDYKWWKISFQAPVALSGPEKIGLDAVALMYPAESKLGQGQLEITLVAVPNDMQEGMGNNNAEIVNYVKATFLGSATPGTKKVERSFLGKKIAGEGQTTSIPKKMELELFLIPLADGDKVAVGFKRDAAWPQEKAEDILKIVAQTFKENKEK
jgi:hypothetical protein